MNSTEIVYGLGHKVQSEHGTNGLCILCAAQIYRQHWLEQVENFLFMPVQVPWCHQWWGRGAWLVPLVELLRLPVGILQICVHRPLEAVPVSSVNKLSILPNI